MDERDERFRKLLQTVAPGTPLREGLENILRARTGGLIVVGDGEAVMQLVDGGFRIDTEFSPARLYELAKMDGAIILSKNANRILIANAQLIPDPSIPSVETGIRHRTAQRVSRQTGILVIAISQRRNVISLYQGNIHYMLRDSSVILAKANQALYTLEKYRAVLNQTLAHLGVLEMEDQATVGDVCLTLQRTDVVIRIIEEIRGYISELGSEGRLVEMQLSELAGNVGEEGSLIVRDYAHVAEDRPLDAVIAAVLRGAEEPGELTGLSRQLGLGSTAAALEAPVTPRGYRILRKIPRLPMSVIENLVGFFHSLPALLLAGIDDLDEVEGIGEARARIIRDGLRRIKDQVLLER